MKKNDQIRAMINVYTELAESQSLSERSTMEALLDIFDPNELAELGYQKRVIAYLREYGCEEELNSILNSQS